jgi:hypothetical protein
MVTVLLGCVFVIALVTAVVMGLIMLQSSDYDAWVREFNERGGIQWAVSDVLDGNQVVSHTVLGERRTTRL